MHLLILTTIIAFLQACDAAPLAPDASPVLSTLFSRDDTCTDATGQTSQWANHDNDGNGHYSGTCGVSGHNSDKCWTDIYVTQSQMQWKPFDVVSAGHDCAHTSTCSITHINSKQACRSESTSVSVGADAGILKDILSISAEVTH